jgi:hypothetical protein
MEKAVDEIHETDGVPAADAMRDWLQTNAPYVFRSE